MREKKKLLIIDGYGFVFRAYHVQPPLTLPDGRPVGAIYGFTSMLVKILSDFKDATYAVVVFDSGGKNFRHTLYPAYKENRPPVPSELISQFNAIRTAATSLNFAIIEQQGVEADDIIATIATSKIVADNIEVLIISSDKDLMQLISPGTKMYDPVKGIYITENEVVKKFGILPQQVRYMLTLVGDTSDNIPGIPGVGPKTAANLINKFPSLEDLYARVNEIDNNRIQQLVINNEASTRISWQLTGLDTNIDIVWQLEDFKLLPPDYECISKFLKEYNFKSLHKRIENLFSIKLNIIEEDNLIHVKKNGINFIEINNIEQFNKLYEEIEKIGILAIQFIYLKKNPVAFIIAFNNNLYNLVYTIIEDKRSDLFTYNRVKKDYWFNEILLNLLTNPAIKKITRDLKTLLKFFKTSEGESEIVACEDLELMEYCNSAGLPQSLTYPKEINNLSNNEIITQIGLQVINYEKQYNETNNILFKEKILNLYKDIDLPLVYILNKMEMEGVKVDLNGLKKLSVEFGTEIKILEQKIFDLAGEQFNIASSKQLGEILFNKLSLPYGKASPKANSFSTGAEILEKLVKDGHEIAGLLLAWRGLSKLKSTYTDALQDHIDDITGRIHTTLQQTSTTTSRLSSHEPNLQNIPIRSIEGNKIRGLFIAKEGYKLISADYSQIELRILAHIANVDNLKEAFLNNKDIHNDTAIKIFNLPQNELTSEHRRKAKAINFGIIYGISAFGLAKQLKISNSEAMDYINKYFEKYPQIKEYMENTKAFAKSHGYVMDLLGRKCYVPLIHEKNNNLKQVAERAAINAPIQGSNAEIIKIAMININHKLKQMQLKTKLILQIHDELLFEAPINEIEIILPLIKQVMENAYLLSLPLIVDVRVGNNWQEIH